MNRGTMSEMIEDLKEMLRCYEYIHDENSPANKEIMFWRDKFIEDKFSNNLEINHIKNHFFCIPSNEFIKHSIKYWEDLLKNHSFKE